MESSLKAQASCSKCERTYRKKILINFTLWQLKAFRFFISSSIFIIEQNQSNYISNILSPLCQQQYNLSNMLYIRLNKRKEKKIIYRLTVNIIQGTNKISLQLCALWIFLYTRSEIKIKRKKTFIKLIINKKHETQQ